MSYFSSRITDSKLLAHIFGFVPSNSLLYINRHFRDVVGRHLYPLLNKICRNFLINSQSNGVFFSKKVIKRILNPSEQGRDWHQYMKKTHAVIKSCAKDNGNIVKSFGTLDPVFYLSQIVSEDRDLMQFFEALSGCDAIPKMDVFLKSASKIRRWMENNQKRLENILCLDVSGGGICSIPKEIRYFKNVMILNFSDNQISSIPPEITGLSQLTILNISRNRLSSLPEESFSKLISLEEVSLHNNQFSTFPAAVLSLPQLAVLNLAFNQIEHVSMEKGHLSSLKELDLSHNRLMELPQSLIERLREVRIDLRGNIQLKRLKINVKYRSARIKP